MTSSIREVVKKAYGTKVSSPFSFRSTLFQLPEFKTLNGEELLQVGLSARARIQELSLRFADVAVVFCGSWNVQDVRFVIEATTAMRWIYRRANVGFRRFYWRLVPKTNMSKGLQEAFDDVGSSLTLDDLDSAVSEFCDDFAWEFSDSLPFKAIPIYVFPSKTLAVAGDASGKVGWAPEIAGDCGRDFSTNGDWGVVVSVPQNTPAALVQYNSTLVQTQDLPPADEFGAVMPAASGVVPLGNVMAHELGHFFGLLHVCTEFGTPTNECSDLPWTLDDPCPELTSAQAAIDNFMNPNAYGGTSYQIVPSQEKIIHGHCALQGFLGLSSVGQ